MDQEKDLLKLSNDTNLSTTGVLRRRDIPSERDWNIELFRPVYN